MPSNIKGQNSKFKKNRDSINVICKFKNKIKNIKMLPEDV